MKKKDRQPVKFLRNYNIYRKGEVAGFSPTIVKRLVEKKIAKRVKKNQDNSDFKDLSYKELQKLAKDEGLKYVGVKKEELKKRLEEVE